MSDGWGLPKPDPRPQALAYAETPVPAREAFTAMEYARLLFLRWCIQRGLVSEVC